MTDPDVLQAFEQLFRAQRELALCEESLRIKKATYEQAELDEKQAREIVEARLADIRRRAEDAAGIRPAAPEFVRSEFVPIRR